MTKPYASTATRHCPHRCYIAAIGQFLSVDPMLTSTLAPYSYASERWSALRYLMSIAFAGKAPCVSERLRRIGRDGNR
jgi:hypothetical protein